MARHKRASAGLHARAERAPLQRAMLTGSVNRGQLAAYFGQLWLIRRALEQRLRECRNDEPALQRVNHDYQFRAEDLQRDLASLDVNTSAIRPSPAVEDLLQHLDRIVQNDPIAMLGMLYVLEGSTNGSKFIAQRLTRVPELADCPRLRSLDPYRDRQAERWRTFKTDMDGLELDDARADAIVDAAKRMFIAIAELSDDVAIASNLETQAVTCGRIV